MALKQMIGKILSELGFVTQKQIEEALSRQMQIYREKMLPESLERALLVTKARYPGEEALPFLGQILIDMGYVTRSQIETALKKQQNMLEKYFALESNILCSVMDLVETVNSSLNLVEVLALIMNHANRLTHSAASTLMLVEEKTGDLVFSVPTGPSADELVDIRIHRGQGIAGWVAEHDEPVIVTDAKRDPRFYAGIDKKTGFETKSILAVPLKAKNKLIGVLEVINKLDGTPFNEEDALLLSVFASSAAMAIENARLYDELRDCLECEKKLQIRLMESSKFLALGQLASGVAHDFNNVLGAIMGYTELAIMNITEEHPVKRNLAQVLKAAYRAKDVVNQILVYARHQEIECKPADLRKIIQETLHMLRASLPSPIEIRQSFGEGPCTVMADATKIHQIIMNLCTNAYHAMADTGGILSLSLLPFNLEKSFDTIVGDLRPGRYLKLSISDTGCGMDAETLKQIFDPYFSTKSKGMGTGLGLSVVHGIVKSHNGAIRVTSEPGKGTTFEVFLPQAPEEEACEVDFGQELPSGNECILFVDDEELLAAVGRQMLERLGYRVLAMTDPREALMTFQQEADAFDLIITDMTMPNMTGEKLAKEMMHVRPDIPIILCTGFSERITEERSRKIGIKAFSMKPFAIRDLALTVRKVLDEIL